MTKTIYYASLDGSHADKCLKDCEAMIDSINEALVTTLPNSERERRLNAAKKDLEEMKIAFLLEKVAYMKRTLVYLQGDC